MSHKSLVRPQASPARRCHSVLLAVLAATSASSAFAGGIEMYFKLRPDGSRWGFYDRGFPSDLKIDDQGRMDFSAFPAPPLNVLVGEYKKVIERDSRGFAPETPIYVRLLGLQKGMMAEGADPLSYTQPGSSIQLIDVDPLSPERGRQQPIQLKVSADADTYRPADLLQVRPAGQPLREGTKYALIITKKAFQVPASQLQPNAALNLVLKGIDPRKADPWITQAAARRALAAYAPLRDELVRRKVSSDDVVAAVVWTTGRPSDTPRRIAKAAHEWPIPALKGAWAKIHETADHCVLKANWTVPGLQQGTAPYALSGGQIQYDANGKPVINYYRDTPVVISVPKLPMPAAGFPLVLYHHGTGGNADQLWNRGITVRDASGNEVLTQAGSVAQTAALRGWAGAGMGGHFGEEHQALSPFNSAVFTALGLPMNIAQYNFFNPQAMRDSLLQQLAERTLFRRLVSKTRLTPDLCPGAGVAQGDSIRFDPGLQVVMGQSLGSFTSSAQAATDDPVAGLITSGAGTYNIDLVLQITALGSSGKPLGETVGPVFFGARGIASDPFHPVYALAENALAPANNAYMVARKKREELETGRHRTHALAVDGHVDDWVALPNQRQLIRSLGASMAGPELDVKDPAKELLLPTALWAGGRAYPYPAVGNEPAGVSNFFVRYAQDSIKSGHYVLFQLAPPKHQVGCFLQDLAAGMSPVIVKGESIDGPCASGPSLKKQ